MKLLIPDNRLCPDKTTRYPVTGINPVLWLKTESPDYTVVSIDGFIVSKDQQVNGFFKKFEYVEEQPDEEISMEAIHTVFPESEILLLKNLSEEMNCGFYTFLWPENFPEGYTPDSKLIHSYTFDFTDARPRIKTHKQISISDLERGIRMLRGKSFPNVKNLNAATSHVECYLANKTKNPWPGDIDTLIYDHTSAKYVAIVEFKTHNLNSPVEKEHIGKYGEQDWRRFHVLFDLAANFKEKLGYAPALFFVVWGTNPDSKRHATIKIDLIEQHQVVKSFLFPRPAYNRFSDALFRFILKAAHENSLR